MSSFPPVISFGNSCASDFELAGRLSSRFRMNVYYNNIVMSLTVLLTYMAVKKMLRKKMFSKTTRNLLFFSMLFYIIHDIYFAWTLNWSFYRSITQSNDSCKIMFHGSECFFLYLIGIFLRVLLLYSQCAVTLERLVITFLPNSDLINSATLNVLTLLMSVITTSVFRPISQSEYNSPNCFQQLYPGMKTIRSLIWVMVAFDVFCFPINFAVMMRYRRKFQNFQSKHGYDLKSRYVYKNNMYSAMMVSIISFVQTLLYTVYIIGLIVVLGTKSDVNGLLLGTNDALWCYTFPLAGLALPCSILLSYMGLTIKKNNKIAVLKTTEQNYDQDAHFKDLVNSWNNPNIKRF